MSAPPPFDWRRALLDFWFGLAPEQHWRRDPALDADITARFGETWRTEQSRPAEDFLNTPEDALAAVLLFDQAPRNMFRDDPRAFATDPLARTITHAVIERGFDAALPTERRHFVYMPLEHSETLADQEQSVAMFEKLGDAYFLEFARKHRDVIARFGRFPHRNPVLGRASTPEEEAFGLKEPW